MESRDRKKRVCARCTQKSRQKQQQTTKSSVNSFNEFLIIFYDIVNVDVFQFEPFFFVSFAVLALLLAVIFDMLY